MAHRWGKPHAVTSRALARRPTAPGMAAVEEDREDQDTAIGASRISVRRAISGPLTPVTSGLSRSLADSLLRRSAYITGRTVQIPKLIMQFKG
jgi:hypothetical protein